ncbi:MAG: ABC transporter ATP-binding protein [Anaerolineales bacterium]|nr:ABC transporter ATP-binding protein [Anaerolineales bacterium]
MSNVILRTDGLTKSYGPLVAVNDLTIEIYEGEILGFLGPNGAGKTTSINMICGLLKPDRGEVFIHGVPIESGGADLRGRVGVCPQDVILWDRLTCMEQLLFLGQMFGMSRKHARSRANVLLGEFGLEGKSKAQARTLSGGMQRRLNLAMALIHDPEILLLDEPEVGLDPQSRVSVRRYIRSLARTKTIILTTHNMDEADRLADRVAIIDHGEMLVIDTPEALKRSIGEGDVLEIEVQGRTVDQESASRSFDRLSEGASFEFAHDMLIVRAPHVVRLLSSIVEVLAEEGVECGDIRLRETSLEDVFIHLTGRRLRE